MEKKLIIVQYLINKAKNECDESSFSHVSGIGIGGDLLEAFGVANKCLSYQHDLIQKLEDIINEIIEILE